MTVTGLARPAARSADDQGAVLVRGRGDVRHREQRLRDAASMTTFRPLPHQPGPPDIDKNVNTRHLFVALTGGRTQPREMGSGRAVPVAGTGRGVVRGRGVAGLRPSVGPHGVADLRPGVGPHGVRCRWGCGHRRRDGRRGEEHPRTRDDQRDDERAVDPERGGRTAVIVSPSCRAVAGGTPNWADP